jgi:hypothetical protein
LIESAFFWSKEAIDDVEGGDELLAREDVAVGGDRPAEQREVVQQALGDESAVAVVEKIGLRIALRQFLGSLATHERQVPESGNEVGHAELDEGKVQRYLAGGAREQIFAAQHVRDPHQSIVDRVDKGVKRGAIGTHDDEVCEAASRKSDGSADQVVEAQIGIRNPQTQGRLASLRAVCGALLGTEPTLEVVVALLRIAAIVEVAGFHLLGSDEALVEQTEVDHSINEFAIDVGALGLPVRPVRAALLDTLVPVQSQPAERIEQL